MKYLLDTNIYFAVLRSPAFLQAHQALLRRIGPATYLSSVVLLELLQGAKGDIARARIAQATQTLERTGRVIAPTHADWVTAGTTQSRIRDEHASLRSKAVQNDLLIACTARRIGAVVVTENTADFDLIRRYLAHRALSVRQLARDDT